MGKDEENLYFKLMKFAPSLESRIRNDAAHAPTPDNSLSGNPVFDPDAHRARIKTLWEKYPLVSEKAIANHNLETLTECYRYKKPWMLVRSIHNCIASLFRDNHYHLPELPYVFRDDVEEWKYRLSSTSHRTTAEENILVFFRYYIDMLPQTAFQEERPLGNEVHLPVANLIGNLRAVLANALDTFGYSKSGNYPAFRTTRRQLYDNIIRFSGFDPETYDYKRPLKDIAEFKGTPTEFVDTFFIGTPFLWLLAASLPFSIPLQSYKEHGFILAKSGHGKSQSLRALFSSLLKEDCAVFLIDGNGSLIKNLDKLEAIQDRLIILDPEDTPALNFYKLHGASREKQMELFFYLFKAIDQGLTERQATMVAYLVDFMHAIPGSTLDTLREVCDAKDLPYREHLSKTPKITQDFFNNQFLSTDQLVKQTKAQIAARLYTLCRNTTFINMFNAPENRFDAYKAMQEKKIVIVNTDRNVLGDHGSAVFGRYILAQCLAAAFQRPEHERHLALLIVDEAKSVLDDQSQKILSDARAFGVGLLLATQFPDQLQEGVRKEVINNTTIKLAGPMAYSVVAQINRDMRCSADFILGMKKTDTETNWACYIDNLTPHAIQLPIPFGVIETLPHVSRETHEAMRARNRARFSAPPKPPPLPPTPPISTPSPPKAKPRPRFTPP
jgi:hypothetical protein